MFQLKDMAERLPPGAYDPESLKLVYMPNGLESNGAVHNSSGNGEKNSNSEDINAGIGSGLPNGTEGPTVLLRDPSGSSELGLLDSQGLERGSANGTNDARLPNGGGAIQSYRSSVSDSIDGKDSVANRDSDAGSKSRNSSVPGSASQIEAEWIEQYEPGVYITLVALRDGTRDLKRVRFRYSFALTHLSRYTCSVSYILGISYLSCAYTDTAGEDSGNTKRRRGGRRIEKRYTRSTTYGDRTSHRWPAGDRREVYHHPHRFRLREVEHMRCGSCQTQTIWRKQTSDFWPPFLLLLLLFFVIISLFYLNICLFFICSYFVYIYLYL